MLARLGRVLDWTCSTVAVLAFAGLALLLNLTTNWQGEHIPYATLWALAVAVPIWLFGRGCRYVLSGE